jgi:hypothetical protein
MWLRFRPAALIVMAATVIPVAAMTAAMAPPATAASVLPSSTAGHRLWVARFDSANRGAMGTSVAVSPSGSEVFVTGPSHFKVGPVPQWATIAYNTATGAQVWVARYNGGIGDPAVAVSPDGSEVFVTGSAHSGMVTLAYDATTGQRLWTYQPDIRDQASPAALAVSSDGSTVYAMGWAGERGQGYQDFYEVFAINAATGAQRWADGYEFQHKQAPEVFSATGIAVSPNGAGVFVTGTLGTVAFNASTGAVLWVNDYPVKSDKYGYAIAVSPSSSTVFITGQAPHVPQTGYWTVAYNASTGAAIWTSFYADKGASGATSIGASPNGSAVFVTGTTESIPTPHGMRIVTVAYNPATGAQLWVASWRNESPDVTQLTKPALAVAPDSSTVAVTGTRAVNGGPRQYATLVYDASTGANEMTARYQGPDNGGSIPLAIALSPDSPTVFVTGESTPNRIVDYFDYATVAYRF